MMEIGSCGHLHDTNDDDDVCRHGQVVFDGFQFGDTVPEHKDDTRYGPHVASECGWCLLYGNTQPLTRDNRRCEACNQGDHGACKVVLGCDCACVRLEASKR